MENLSPSQDDKLEARKWKRGMGNILSFLNFLSQGSESNTDGIINAFDVAEVNRQMSPADVMLVQV